ncbi:MAG: hypothetical protein M3Q07_23560 [Pseudobdellovibrionaceae bacterium]|nr:hypothetical protein [Pseudobdellovibrionaceae bacterium]
MSQANAECITTLLRTIAHLCKAVGQTNEEAMDDISGKCIMTLMSAISQLSKAVDEAHEAGWISGYNDGLKARYEDTRE